MQFYKRGAAVFGALTVLAGLVAATISATSGTFTNLTSTNATTTNLVVTGAATLPGTLTATVPTFTTGNLVATSTLIDYGSLSVFLGTTLSTLNATSSIITPSLNASSTQFNSGTAITFHAYGTATVDADSIAAGGTTTTSVTVTGAAAGDTCDVTVTAGDLWSTTSTAVVSCRAGTGSATVNVYNATSTSAFDAGSSTLKVNVWRH